MVARNAQTEKMVALNVQTENMVVALNAQTKKMVALNTETKNMVALNIELKKNDGFERQTKDATLNAKMKRRGDNEWEICPSMAPGVR